MIDIIIVTYNAKKKLKRCLKSVEEYTKNIDYLLTIVNNNSADRTFRFLEKYRKQKNIQVVNTKKNLGFCGGANLALKKTTNKFIVLLDDDAEVADGWLSKLRSQVSNRPKVGIVGAKIIFPDKRIFSAGIFVGPNIIFNIGFNEMDNARWNCIKEVDAVNGACWLMRRKLIEKIGYFDEQFYPCQFEDVDYCIRAKLAGYKIIYNGEASIIHHHLFRDGNKDNWGKFIKKWHNLSMFSPKGSSL